jgi:hypothetical protein
MGQRSGPELITRILSDSNVFVEYTVFVVPIIATLPIV